MRSTNAFFLHKFHLCSSHRQPFFVLISYKIADGPLPTFTMLSDRLESAQIFDKILPKNSPVRRRVFRVLLITALPR